MNLHEDREAFSEFVQVAAEKVGFPQVFVEKDYWVTKALKHLSESEYVDETVFKGGTSLSKAYRLIERFSEDIDLAIISNGKGDNVRKNLLKGIESEVAKSLIYIPNDVRESKGSKYRKTVYRYPHSIEDSGFGQVSSDLLIEVNAFTQPEPFEKRVLSSFIAEMLAGKQRSDLIEQYGLHDFSLNVLSVKRTLVEKILRIIRDSYHENPIAELSRQIRHIYDICLIMRKEEYQDFCQNKEFSSLCQKCIEDEKDSFPNYQQCLEKPLSEAPLFSAFESWSPFLESVYNTDFSELVYGELPAMDEITSTLRLLKDCLI